MRSFNSYSVRALAIAALASSGVVFEACSSSNSNPAPPVYGDDAGDATTTPQPDASPDGTGSTTDGNGDSPGPDGSSSGGGDASDSGTGPETGPTCTSVLTDAGCWTCPTATDGSVEFLNQCSGTGVHCVSFDNLGRLPGFDAGLPPLN